ncbi:hypothetical protein B0H16DRAFT_1537852 [Mycena metata]|uniref:Uncharacterized protein n=1 Tax=Mycena metata TaxID=1033252 RepID=A0AAD7J619_9AGAR|nr:hypothetical protein B0H16DRAFT_1537852 [Mycena metata]
MPLLCFVCFATRSRRDSVVLDFDSVVLDCDAVETTETRRPRRQVEEPPHLGTTTTNLFDTFPRVGFGGYRRYYERRMKTAAIAATGACTHTSSKSAILTTHPAVAQTQTSPVHTSPTSFSFQPSLSSIEEHEWGWQTLPKFTGRKPRRRSSSRRTTSSLHSNSTSDCPQLQLRKKPRFRASARPLVDTTYAWPNWLAEPYSPPEAKTFGEKDDAEPRSSESSSSSSSSWSS